MLSVLQDAFQQIPLIHIVHEDDLVLLGAPDAAWFEVLYCFPWKDYQVYGAQYYDALHEFNIREAKKRQERSAARETVETEEDAKQTKIIICQSDDAEISRGSESCHYL